MCGIIGYVGSEKATPLLVQGLQRLEYRGYDSVGIATMCEDGQLNVLKTPGRIARLVELLAPESPSSQIGIGHSRWATHGPATSENAHPHIGGDGDLALVHNGVIENHDALRSRLEAAGYRFRSETDTEVIAHLIHWCITRIATSDAPTCDEIHEHNASRARILGVQQAMRELEGSYALVILFRDQPDMLMAARCGSPLVIGVADNGYLVGSDGYAISHRTQRLTRLHDHDLAVMRADSLQVLQADSGEPSRELLWCDEVADAVAYDDMGDFPHQTLKEIHQQPTSLRRTLSTDYAAFTDPAGGPLANLPTRIQIVACGTSWHAGLYGKYLIEELAGIPVDIEYASEYRYRVAPHQDGTLLIAASQSGETADTVGALRDYRRTKQPSLTICNVRGSTLAEEADAAVFLNVGQESGVAATKSYTAQCAVFARLAVALGRRRATLNGHARLVDRDLQRLPGLVARVLQDEDNLRQLAETLADANRFLFVGRGYDYATALEGALKLKEISYLSAEGYAAGELKHGPLALVDRQTPTFALATPGRTYEKVLSNLAEIRARGGRIVAIGVKGDQRLQRVADDVVQVGAVAECLQPLVNIVPLQLLAYHLAAARGCDVDRPRNLAKSVTVE